MIISSVKLEARIIFFIHQLYSLVGCVRFYNIFRYYNIFYSTRHTAHVEINLYISRNVFALSQCAFFLTNCK